jgi:predicted DNA-binding transcriptional regulator AlpA
LADSPTLTAAEVAALLGWETGTFYRKVTDLKRHHGFPPPMPGGRRYSRAAVLAWIDRGGTPAPAPAAPLPGLDADVVACEARLLDRARSIGEMA